MSLRDSEFSESLEAFLIVSCLNKEPIEENRVSKLVAQVSDRLTSRYHAAYECSDHPVSPSVRFYLSCVE